MRQCATHSQQSVLLYIVSLRQSCGGETVCHSQPAVSVAVYSQSQGSCGGETVCHSQPAVSVAVYSQSQSCGGETVCHSCSQCCCI